MGNMSIYFYWYNISSVMSPFRRFLFKNYWGKENKDTWNAAASLSRPWFILINFSFLDGQKVASDYFIILLTYLLHDIRWYLDVSIFIILFPHGFFCLLGTIATRNVLKRKEQENCVVGVLRLRHGHAVSPSISSNNSGLKQ